MPVARQRHVLRVLHLVFRALLPPRGLRAHRVHVPLGPPHFRQTAQFVVRLTPLLGGDVGDWIGWSRGGEVPQACVLPDPPERDGALQGGARGCGGGQRLACRGDRREQGLRVIRRQGVSVCCQREDDAGFNVGPRSERRRDIQSDPFADSQPVWGVRVTWASRNPRLEDSSSVEAGRTVWACLKRRNDLEKVMAVTSACRLEPLR